VAVVSDGVQPGTEVDRELWERFREDVKRRKGGVRGHIRTELENALRAYIHGGDATPVDVDARLQRIEAELGIAPADGGADTVETPQDTHTRQPVPEEKPAANAATEKKVRWLAQRVREDRAIDPAEAAEVPPQLLRETVKEAYGFRRDTAKRYVDRLADELGLSEHPDPNVDLLITDAKRKQLREQERVQADDQLDDL